LIIPPLALSVASSRHTPPVLLSLLLSAVHQEVEQL
jgi:hypothetical protein